MQMTLRDERMLEWLSTVRLADMDAVRWALAGFEGAERPVSLRRAQQWVARLFEVGLVDRGRPTFRDGSIVWATFQVTGKARPNLFKQTTRHEVAVAATSARFIAGGATWTRDRVPASKADHMADGVAERDGLAQLVEVELTTKTLQRYRAILPDHVRRIHAGITRVVYLTTPEAGRAMNREIEKLVQPAMHPHFAVLPILDERGRITDDTFTGTWGTEPRATVEAGAAASPPLPPVPPVPAQLPVWGGRD